MAGQRIGRWTVGARAPSLPCSTGARWQCVCDCGTERIIFGWRIRARESLSCGCAKREATQSHVGNGGPRKRKRDAPLRAIWRGMVKRCHRPSCKGYAGYGARGIIVCDRWREDFLAFAADMGERPTPLHSLDRYPNGEGNYEPGNVRWATPKEQSRNTRTNRRLTVGGVTATIAEWAERTGIRANTIGARLRKGWSHEKSVTTPLSVPQ
jgi:hypothetical protein